MLQQWLGHHGVHVVKFIRGVMYLSLSINSNYFTHKVYVLTF